MKRKQNKKVLLRERKRHTARRVVSTRSVVLPGYPPRGGVPGQVPPRGVPRPSQVPPGGYPVRYPPRGYPDPPRGTQSGTPPGGTQTRTRSGTPLGGYPVRYPPGGSTRSGTPPRGGTWSGTTPREGTWSGTPHGGVTGQVPPLGGYPVRYPPGGTQSGTPPGGYLVRYPPGGYPDPPGGTQSGTPPAAPWHSGKCCKALWDMGTPPPLWTDRWMDGRTDACQNITFPRTPYAGGKYKASTITCIC